MQSVEQRRRKSKIEYCYRWHCDQIEDCPRTMLRMKQPHSAAMHEQKYECAHCHRTQDKYVPRDSAAVYYVRDHCSLPDGVARIGGSRGDAIGQITRAQSLPAPQRRWFATIRAPALGIQRFLATLGADGRGHVLAMKVVCCLTLELSCAAAQPRNPTPNIPRQLQRPLDR